MIDPITAVAMATSAFKTVQKMVSMGREIEDTLGQVGKWYGAVSDFNEAKRQAENPPIFRRLVASKSVEQEALEMYAHDKRIKQQETESLAECETCPPCCTCGGCVMKYMTSLYEGMTFIYKTMPFTSLRGQRASQP